MVCDVRSITAGLHAELQSLLLADIDAVGAYSLLNRGSGARCRATLRSITFRPNRPSTAPACLVSAHDAAMICGLLPAFRQLEHVHLPLRGADTPLPRAWLGGVMCRLQRCSTVTIEHPRAGCTLAGDGAPDSWDLLADQVHPAEGVVAPLPHVRTLTLVDFAIAWEHSGACTSAGVLARAFAVFHHVQLLLLRFESASQSPPAAALTPVVEAAARHMPQLRCVRRIWRGCGGTTSSEEVLFPLPQQPQPAQPDVLGVSPATSQPYGGAAGVEGMCRGVKRTHHCEFCGLVVPEEGPGVSPRKWRRRTH